MANGYGDPKANAVILGVVGVSLVGIVIYVLTTGRADNPALFIIAAVVIVIIGVFVFLKRARS